MSEKSDLLIQGGTIIDGTGNESFLGDIEIANGKIKEIGNLKKESKQSIDAENLIVCPGFIDIHNHVDQAILAFPLAENYIMQGVTTSVVGNCGLSMAPVNYENLADLKRYLSPFLEAGYDYSWDWTTLQEYFEKVRGKGTSVNIVPLVGQGTLRIAVKGFESSIASKEEMKRMKNLLSQSLENGAFGISTGLIYPPGSYSSTEELIELTSILKNYNAIYTTHLRSESDNLVEAVEEAIKIGEENKISIEVSHHKAEGKRNWGKVDCTLELMEKARKRGVDINFDVYPYMAGQTTITSLLPPWSLDGGIEEMIKRLENLELRKKIQDEIAMIEGNEWENMIQLIGWKNIVISKCPVNEKYEGKSLEEILKNKNSIDKPYEGFLEWLLEIKGEAMMLEFSMDEEDLKKVISHPLSSICSDAWVTGPSGSGNPHPRAYGTFPKVIKKYAIDSKLITLEEAVRKMTSLPARKIGLKKRGIIKKGNYADIVAFDKKDIKDKATYSKPRQYPDGIKYVIVNGTIAVKAGKLTGIKSGEILQRKNV